MQSQARDTLPEVKKECDSFDDSGSQYSADNSLDGTCHESTDVDPSEDRDDDGAQSCENASNQIVLYDPGAGDKSQALSVLDPAEQEPPLPKFVESNNSNRVLPSVGAFTVQCATCFKWRLIPTKEKYEEIREHIMEKPFVCETAREWRPDISCEDPADIYQDGSRLWAIDKPSISQPPPGWQRLLRIRGEGSTKFADVYYVAPSGKRLRSMVEIQKYLVEHPEFIQAGVNMSQFSFQIPKPLQENYVRKRQYSKAMRQYDGAALEMTRPLEPGEVNPLSWAGPNTDMRIVTRPDGLPSQCFEASVFDPVAPRAKKQMVKRPSKQMYNTCDQPKVKVEEPQQDRNVAYDL